MHRLCANTTHYCVYHSTLEHPQILASQEVLQPVPGGYQGITVFYLNCSLKSEQFNHPVPAPFGSRCLHLC